MSRFLRLALIGDPVEHSASPRIQRALLAESGIEGTYETIRVAAGEAARAIDRLVNEGYRGLNITTPLKEEAFARSDSVDTIAEESGSVNTMVFDATVAQGYNTDGVGAVESVRGATGRGELQGLNVLVLGAGPTARAAISALQRAGVIVTCWNRTASHAERVCERFGISPWTPQQRADVVFAALAPGVEIDDASLQDALRLSPIVIDANYGERATLAAKLRRPVVDGMPMLQASARASFHLFVSESG